MTKYSRRNVREIALLRNLIRESINEQLIRETALESIKDFFGNMFGKSKNPVLQTIYGKLEKGTPLEPKEQTTLTQAIEKWNSENPDNLLPTDPKKFKDAAYSLTMRNVSKTGYRGRGAGYKSKDGAETAMTSLSPESDRKWSDLFSPKFFQALDSQIFGGKLSNFITSDPSYGPIVDLALSKFREQNDDSYLMDRIKQTIKSRSIYDKIEGNVDLDLLDSLLKEALSNQMSNKVVEYQKIIWQRILDDVWDGLTDLHDSSASKGFEDFNEFLFGEKSKNKKVEAQAITFIAKYVQENTYSEDYLLKLFRAEGLVPTSKEVFVPVLDKFIDKVASGSMKTTSDSRKAEDDARPSGKGGLTYSQAYQKAKEEGFGTDLHSRALELMRNPNSKEGENPLGRHAYVR